MTPREREQAFLERQCIDLAVAYDRPAPDAQEIRAAEALCLVAIGISLNSKLRDIIIDECLKKGREIKCLPSSLVIDPKSPPYAYFPPPSRPTSNPPGSEATKRRRSTKSERT